MDDFAERVAASLRTARAKSGLTQADIAGELGVSQPLVSQYENGKRTPSSRTIDRLATAYRTTPSDLLGTTTLEERVTLLERRVAELEARNDNP